MEFIYDYTSDGLKLQGTFWNTDKKDICVILTHGMCGTIIDNYFATVWGKYLQENNVGFIYGHNRGHSIENDIVMKDGSFKRYGCMYEIFEDCIYDIDLWINKAIELGYKKIILAGHSYGCNKVIYYLSKKKILEVKGVILASAPDMQGLTLKNEKNYYKLLDEAILNIKNNEPTKLLSKMVEDYMYMSSQTYYNWYNEKSNIDNFPILKKLEKWEQLSKIEIPILTFSGSKEDELYLKLELIKEKAINCKDFSFEIIPDTGHTYEGKEIEIAVDILKWIKDKFK